MSSSGEDTPEKPAMAHDTPASPLIHEPNVDISRPKTPPNNTPNLPLPANTPHSRKQCGTQPFTSSHVNIKAEARNDALVKETEGHIVGPMPVERFLHLYVPDPGCGPVPFNQANANGMQSNFRETVKNGEAGMYPLWVGVLRCRSP